MDKKIKDKISKDIYDISYTLKSKGFNVYLVGGSIRDIFLNKDIDDYDLATDATPDQLKKIFPKAILFGEKFGTIMLIIDNNRVEITTLRKESDYDDGRHPSKVSFIKDINEDLKRRDFTVNAIAFDLINFNIIDLFNGEGDITKKIIRAVGNPDARFEEDALRLLRAVRFSLKLGFKIEQNTYNSIKKNAHLIEFISKERVRDEFLKIISGDNSSKGIELLRETGLLQYIMPELLVCVGVMQNKFHSLDVYNHLLLSMDKADEKIKLVALLHDIGKPQTKEGEHFFAHEKVGADIARNILTRLKFPKEEIYMTCKLIQLHLFFYNDSWSDGAVRRFLRKVEDDKSLELLFLLREADEKGNPISTYDFNNLEKFKKRIQKIKEKDRFMSIKDLKINGYDLMKIGYQRDKFLGETLNLLLDAIIEDPSINTKESLLAIAKDKLDHFV
jgi:poly(A) polymerase/tRNA nucleotidyltransferase (CCA-adding enzyme)